MTTQTPIADWVSLNTQTKLAELTGLTQGAIGKMISRQRNVFVVESDDEQISLIENKEIVPLRKKQTA